MTPPFQVQFGSIGCQPMECQLGPVAAARRTRPVASSDHRPEPDATIFSRPNLNHQKFLAETLHLHNIREMPGLIRLTAVLGLVAGLGACTIFHPSAGKNTSKTFSTVVVDAGHGGKDSGAYRRSGPPEKLVTLDVAKRLNQKLRESQLKTVMTRSSDVFISLDERVAIENRQKNAIFVSVHFNDSRRRGVHGFETYYHSNTARELAERIQSKLMTIPHSANRGVHTANFRVLRLATYPAVLVECGFLSNRREGGEARDSEYRELLADKIAEAVVEQRFGSGVYSPPNSVPPADEGPGIAPPSLHGR